MRVRRALLVLAATLSILSVSLFVAPEGAAQLEPAPSDPRLFDLALATSELADLQSRIDSLEAEIAAAATGIDVLGGQLDFLELNRPNRLDTLQDARTSARQLAVAAYMGIQPPLAGFELLNAETATEFSFRNSLVQQQAERLTEAAIAFAILAGEADASELDLSSDINDELRRLEALQRRLRRVAQEVPEADWYVTIAEIHAFASTEFDRTGRAEPTAEQWQNLRRCESPETYDVDTGNGFFGAYQFDWQTWGTVGGDGNPAHAHPAEQDARARVLFAQRGSQPWPICGRFLP